MSISIQTLVWPEEWTPEDIDAGTHEGSQHLSLARSYWLKKICRRGVSYWEQVGIRHCGFPQPTGCERSGQ